MNNISTVLRSLIYTGLFAVLFIPFIVNDQFFFPFIAPKAFAFRIIVEIIFVAWLLLALQNQEYRPKKSWILFGAATFLISLFVSTAVSPNPYKSFWSNFERMEGLISHIHLFMYFVVAGVMLSTEKLWTRFLNTSLSASFLMGIFNLFQLAGKIPINQGGVRIDGTFGNATYLAVYLLFHVFLALLLLARTQGNRRLPYALLILFHLYLLYETQTRGVILGLLGGLLLSAALIALKEENKRIRKFGWAAIAGIGLLVIGFLFVRNTDFVRNNPTLARFAEISLEDTKGQARYYIWPMALKGALERPIFGWGQESFNYVFNKYYDPHLYKHEQWFDRTHNLVLDWLVAGGVVGLFLYLSLFVTALLYLWRSEKFSHRDKSILTGLLAAYFFQNLFVFDNLMSYVMFFSLLAYIHSTAAGEKRFMESFTASPGVSRLAPPAIIALLVVVMYSANVRPIQAGTAIIDGLSPRSDNDISKNLDAFKRAIGYKTLGDAEAREHLTQTTNRLIRIPQVPQELKQSFISTASSEIDRQIEKTPDDTRYLMFAGVLANTIGDYGRAVPYLERARETSPGKQSVYFELGTSFLGKKEYDKALEVFKTAYELEPTYPEAKIIYAVGALYARDETLAKTLFSQLPENTFYFDERVFRAYLDRGEHTTLFAILAQRIKQDPNNVSHRISRAALYLERGERNQAIEELQAAIAIDPSFKERGEYYISEIRAGRNP